MIGLSSSESDIEAWEESEIKRLKREMEKTINLLENLQLEMKTFRWLWFLIFYIGVIATIMLVKILFWG